MFTGSITAEIVELISPILPFIPETTKYVWSSCSGIGRVQTSGRASIASPIETLKAPPKASPNLCYQYFVDSLKSATSTILRSLVFSNSGPLILGYRLLALLGNRKC